MTSPNTTPQMEKDSLAYSVCQFFGNFTIVIMGFFITQGLFHTRSLLNYSERLLGWAMISEVPFYLLFGMRLNILFTLLASLLIILLIDRKGWPLGIAALMLFFPLSWICVAGVSYDGQSFRKQEGKNSWNSFLCILFSASHNNLDNK